MGRRIKDKVTKVHDIIFAVYVMVVAISLLFILTDPIVRNSYYPSLTSVIIILIISITASGFLAATFLIRRKHVAKDLVSYFEFGLIIGAIGILAVLFAYPPCEPSIPMLLAFPPLLLLVGAAAKRQSLPLSAIFVLKSLIVSIVGFSSLLFIPALLIAAQFCATTVSPPTCIALSGFVCPREAVYDSSGITFSFGQITGATFYNASIFVAAAEALNAQGVPVNMSSSSIRIGNLISGNITTVSFPAKNFASGGITQSPSQGTPFAGYVWISYCKASNCSAGLSYAKAATIVTKST